MPVADPVTRYARDVTRGKVVTGPWVRLAAQRHLDDLKHGAERDLVWDPDEAQAALDFFGHLRLAEGQWADQPFKLEPWQQFCVGSLFGWLMVDRTRRFRTAYLEIGKGNGKTPMAAGIGLLGMTADREAGAEVYTAGVTKEQAHYLLDDARAMAAVSPQLTSRLQIGMHNISHPESGSFMRPVSSEGRSLDQKRVHMALIDEIHEHQSGVVVNKMRAGTKGRANAMIVEITNSGYDRTSVCWDHHQKSERVLQGVIVDDEWFAYVCALDEGDDWTDPTVWLKANPNLGVSITSRYLQGQVRDALDMPPQQQLVQRLNFCVWTEASAGAFDMTAWDACSDQPQLEPRQLVWAGLDLSTTTDLTALLWLGVGADGVLDVGCHFWCPEEGVKRRAARDHVPYDVWVRDGWIEATPGNEVDQDRVAAAVWQDLAPYQPRDIGFDPWNATAVAQRLSGEGATVVPVRQGFGSLTAPFKHLLGLVAGGNLRHGGHPVLRWMAANCVAEQDAAGNIKPSKGKSTDRIDGIVALVMALSRYMVDPGQVEGTSMFDDDDYDGDLTA